LVAQAPCIGETFTTMSVEPGIVDTNVLVYALDADAPQHASARALLDAARDDASTSLFVTSQILCEFYSIVTNPRRVPKARTASEAIAAIASLLAFLYVLPVPAPAVDGLLDLLRRHPVTGSDVFDLQIVATMQANSVQRIYTFNASDFALFSELSVVTP
jgi:predicted nucleic acid-binding protein